VRPLPARLLLITDRRTARRPLLEALGEALAGGCRWISVREKDLPSEERLALLQAVVALAKPFGVVVGVHADLALAERLALPALHLPSGVEPREARARLGPRALIGVSAHSTAELVTAAEAGADYATLSPVFPSISKAGYRPAVAGALLGVLRGAPLPVVALGGVTAHNARACLEAGAAAVAVTGAVMGAADPREATQALLATLGDGHRTS
jgi:thiamine-phosphate pyrophosphorylase